MNWIYTKNQLPERVINPDPTHSKYEYPLCLCVLDNEYTIMYFDWNTIKPTWLSQSGGDTVCNAMEVEKYLILKKL